MLQTLLKFGFAAYCDTLDPSQLETQDPEIFEKSTKTSNINEFYCCCGLILLIGIFIYFLGGESGSDVISSIPKVLSKSSIASGDSMTSSYNESRLKWLAERGFLPPVPESVGDVVLVTVTR